MQLSLSPQGDTSIQQSVGFATNSGRLHDRYVHHKAQTTAMVESELVKCCISMCVCVYPPPPFPARMQTSSLPDKKGDATDHLHGNFACISDPSRSFYFNAKALRVPCCKISDVSIVSRLAKNYFEPQPHRPSTWCRGITEPIPQSKYVRKILKYVVYTSYRHDSNGVWFEYTRKHNFVTRRLKHKLLYAFYAMKLLLTDIAYAEGALKFSELSGIHKKNH